MCVHGRPAEALLRLPLQAANRADACLCRLLPEPGGAQPQSARTSISSLVQASRGVQGRPAQHLSTVSSCASHAPPRLCRPHTCADTADAAQRGRDKAEITQAAKAVAAVHNAAQACPCGCVLSMQQAARANEQAAQQPGRGVCCPPLLQLQSFCLCAVRLCLEAAAGRARRLLGHLRHSQGRQVRRRARHACAGEVSSGSLPGLPAAACAPAAMLACLPRRCSRVRWRCPAGLLRRQTSRSRSPATWAQTAGTVGPTRRACPGASRQTARGPWPGCARKALRCSSGARPPGPAFSWPSQTPRRCLPG